MKFGRCGEGRGELNGPVGIVTSDNMHVSELENHRISVFTSSGHHVTSFGRKGKGLGQFKFPTDLAVDSNGVVYVCDYNNNSVQIF